MENSEICSKVAKCPIYSGFLTDGRMLTETYKSLFCENGKEGRTNCKRFQVSLRIGNCPDDLLPDSKLEVYEIINSIINCNLSN